MRAVKLEEEECCSGSCPKSSQVSWLRHFEKVACDRDRMSVAVLWVTSRKVVCDRDRVTPRLCPCESHLTVAKQRQGRRNSRDTKGVCEAFLKLEYLNKSDVRDRDRDRRAFTVIYPCDHVVGDTWFPSIFPWKRDSFLSFAGKHDSTSVCTLSFSFSFFLFLFLFFYFFFFFLEDISRCMMHPPKFTMLINTIFFFTKIQNMVYGVMQK